MDIINCLSYALRFWALHPEYIILYNEYHAINVPEGTYVINSNPKFLNLEDYGYSFLLRSFGSLLTEEDKYLLDNYLDSRIKIKEL